MNSSRTHHRHRCICPRNSGVGGAPTPAARPPSASRHGPPAASPPAPSNPGSRPFRADPAPRLRARPPPPPRPRAAATRIDNRSSTTPFLPLPRDGLQLRPHSRRLVGEPRLAQGTHLRRCRHPAATHIVRPGCALQLCLCLAQLHRGALGVAHPQPQPASSGPQRRAVHGGLVSSINGDITAVTAKTPAGTASSASRQPTEYQSAPRQMHPRNIIALPMLPWCRVNPSP